MPDTIEIVLAVYDPKGTYCRHAGVLTTSLFARTKRRIRVTILHDSTLTEDNRLRLRRTADRYGQKIEFIDTTASATRTELDLDQIAKHFSRGTLYRLFIPELLDAEKAIYIDCDVAVNTDIGELWDIPLTDVSLGVTLDNEASPEVRRKMRSKIRSWAMGYDAKNYFNAGVLLMNLKRIRQRCDLAAEGARFFRRFHHCAHFFPDQDFLNRLFQNDVLFIDSRFDRIGDSLPVENAILHLTGKYKPWILHRSTPRDYFYWRTFAESEWRDQLVDAMMETYKNNPVAHFHSSDCLRRLLDRWKKDLLTKNIFVRAFQDLNICATELRYRIFGMSGDSKRK